MSWTDENRAEVLRRWQLGDSASQIAKAIGDGVTRNAVIGVVSRAGLTSETRVQMTKSSAVLQGRLYRGVVASKPNRATIEARSKAAKAAIAAGEPAPAWVKPREVPASIAQAPRHWFTRKHGECAWPIGEGADTLSCCNRVTPAKPYCAEHERIAHVPARAKTVSKFQAYKGYKEQAA